VIVGVQTHELRLPGCASLKEKRGAILSLKKRIRTRFNVSIAETALQDRPDRAELTVAVVAAHRGHADTLLDKVDAFVEADGRVVMGPVRRELL
jgi:hypothetical protein